MIKTQSFIDLLSTNLAYIFHHYLFNNNKNICSHKLSCNKNFLSTNLVKKVRINKNKYNDLVNSIYSQQLNNNLQVNDNKLRKKTNSSKHKKRRKKNRKRKVNTKNKSKKRNIKRVKKKKSSKLNIRSSHTSSSSKLIDIPLSKDSTHKKIEDHQSPKINFVSSSETSIIEQENNSINSTLYISEQCRNQMKSLNDMKPIVNKDYINIRYLSNELDLKDALQHKKLKQYSKDLKPEQLFRCPKDSRSKRRKCCGIYYELFDDAWHILEGWFTKE